MSEMFVSFHVKSSDPAVREHRLSLCAQVQKCLQSEIPDSCSPTVLCLIDDMDYDFLKSTHGHANRGLFAAPIKGQGLAEIIPSYFWNLVAPADPHTLQPNYLFDTVIYLHGSTSRTDIGLVLTLAHELCHFIQYASRRSIWTANKLIGKLGDPHIRVWWDIPIEVEARQVAKRIAEQLFGDRVVRTYIEERVREPIDKEDGEDWRFILNLSKSTPYSAVEPTMVLVERHRHKLKAIQSEHWMGHPDVSRLVLDTVELKP